MAVTLRNGICMPLIGCKDFIHCWKSHFPLGGEHSFRWSVFFKNKIYFLIHAVGTFRVKGREAIFNCLDAALNSGYRSIGLILPYLTFHLSCGLFLCDPFWQLDSAVIYHNEEDIGSALEKLLPKHNLLRADIFLTSKLCNNYKFFKT